MIGTASASTSLWETRRCFGRRFRHAGGDTLAAMPPYSRGIVRAMTRVLLAILVGCGASATHTSDSTRETSRQHGSTPADPESSTEDDAESPEPEASATPAPCAERVPRDCRADAGCILERDLSCREPRHECELIQIDPSTRPLVFATGDPCQYANPACAWDTSARRCAAFVPVPACPATSAEATALSVHSDQPALSCSYDDGNECACVRTPYCGGAPPGPEQQHPPAIFGCMPEFDDRGCPTRSVREGSRCMRGERAIHSARGHSSLRVCGSLAGGERLPWQFVPVRCGSGRSDRASRSLVSLGA